MKNRIPEAPPSLHFDTFSQHCLDLFKEMSVNSLIYKVMKYASYSTNAQYSICGLIDSKTGEYIRRQIYGLTEAEWKFAHDMNSKIATPPRDLTEPLRTKNRVECKKYKIFADSQPNVNSILYVPINFNNQRIGALTLINKIGGHEFSAYDQMLAEILCSYAGIALNNAIIYEQSFIREKTLAKRNEDLALLNDLARIFTDPTISAGFDTLIESMMDLIMDYLDFEVGEYFGNSTEKPEEYTLIFKKGHSHPGSIFGFSTQILGEGVIGKVAKSKQPFVFSEKLITIVNENKGDGKRLNYIIMLPVISSEGCSGVICLGARMSADAEPVNIQFLTSIASWVATLIDNLRMANQRQKIAILEERNRIGMDLHDGVIQSIFGVGLALENARLTATEDPEKTAELIQVCINSINSTITDIRSYIMDLKPRKLTDENIIQSMRILVNDFHANTLITADFYQKVERVDKLKEDQVSALYMICKESLSNVAKHAKATHVNVDFVEKDDTFTLHVMDNGVGFDTGETRDSSHHGLTNMNGRVEKAGGTVRIISAPGQGTIIEVAMPIIRD